MMLVYAINSIVLVSIILLGLLLLAVEDNAQSCAFDCMNSSV